MQQCSSLTCNSCYRVCLLRVVAGRAVVFSLDCSGKQNR